MAFGDGFHQGQPQAGAAALAVARGFQPHERLEHTLAILVNNALRQAQDALAAPEESRLQAARDALELQHQHID